MNQQQQPNNKAVPQSVVLLMAIGFVGLLTLGIVFRKHLEF